MPVTKIASKAMSARQNCAKEAPSAKGLPEPNTMSSRILTTHVGSLVRPPELSRYIEAIDSGVKADQAAFDRCLSHSVAESVKQQQKAGIDIVSDGEFGKFRSWSFYVLDRLGGIEEREIEVPPGAGPDQKTVEGVYAEYCATQKLAQS